MHPTPLELRSDCTRCVGLCCVALPFARSSDFAFDKPAGDPCRHLAADFGCRIHADLRGRGMPGCTVYECFGAGQHVTQGTYGGHSWADDPALAREMFAVFPVMRHLHELLAYLTEALVLTTSEPLGVELATIHDEVADLTEAAPAVLQEVDVA